MGKAACRERKIPTKEFFPVRGNSRAIAKMACESCTVGAECDDYAERTGSLGIWNGRVRSPKTHDQETP